MGDLAITGSEDADRLLNADPTALVIGMLLDQQVPMGWAFRGPSTLKERLGHLDPSRIAAMKPDEVAELCQAKPAIHRFPASMGRRIHELCRHISDNYGGETSAVWSGVSNGNELYERVAALPGYGDEKARIFIALLAKRFGVTPEGWEEAAAPFSDETPRSAADVYDEESLRLVKEWKRHQRTAGKGKQE